MAALTSWRYQPILARNSSDGSPFPQDSVYNSDGDDDARVIVVETTGEKLDEPALRATSYLFVLSLSFGALQIVFAVLSSYGSSQLLSVGLSKTSVGLTWLAGPLVGTFVQPYIGIRSDRCRLRCGKRRIFVGIGVGGIIFCLLGLGWAPDLISTKDEQTIGKTQMMGYTLLCKSMTLICMVALQIAIQPVQVGLRALIIDTCPSQQQSRASAWAAAAMIGIGNIIGQLSGATDLPKLLPFLANTQFKDLCLVTLFALLLSLSGLWLFIKERGPEKSVNEMVESTSCQPSDGRRIVSAMWNLPQDVLEVWKIQFFSWMGWFLFIYYITIYIDKISLDHLLTDDRQLNGLKGLKFAKNESLRSGPRVMLLYSCISLISSTIFPYIISPSSSLVCSGKFMDRIWKSKLTFSNLWTGSQILFSICMFSSCFVSTTEAVTALVATMGVS
ncbi:uncharacterized protein LY89DRAFT_778647 [Mollisia scopiformis]|uniref:Sucrose transporter n=1 Tax=Mollisia scopiformis TaxID=149040 RepID=A0A194XLQ9_MOLSC|nr:uncharacterized protein LY89DRAFT_778647 [Mollisia scopiformis]KUJ21019.1 hypothetical protein LY89DRAFT_778647 [Mollisia scopiformis]